MADAIDPATWADPALRRALARRDVPAVYRLLTAAGMTQRRIAELARRAIEGVVELRSVRARDRLEPLERALDARRDATAQDLVRRVAAVRAM